MKICLNFVCREHPDRSWQNIVQRYYEIGSWDHRIGLERRDLRQSMHSRVGPSRALR
jgi:hypothetical protein